MKGLVCVCITAAAGLAASASSATPSHYVRVFTNDQFGSCDSGQLAGASASCSSAITVTALGISQQASGTVGLGRGVLDVGASGTGSNLFGASAMAVGADEMFDTLTFHGPGGQVTVTMSAKVALSAPFSGGPPGHFFGQADAYIGLEGLDTSGHEIADAADCSPGANSRFCTPFHEGNAVITNSADTYSITETFSVGDGSVLGLLFTAGAESNGDASASVEDPITVTLPTGVTYTSASGRFLTAAGVPEPAGWAVLICGLGLLGAATRGRRTRSLEAA